MSKTDKDRNRLAVGRAQALHKQVKKWFEQAAKLQSQGRKIPASKLRERMQTVAWGLSGILRELEGEGGPLGSLVLRSVAQALFENADPRQGMPAWDPDLDPQTALVGWPDLAEEQKEWWEQMVVDCVTEAAGELSEPDMVLVLLPAPGTEVDGE